MIWSGAWTHLNDLNSSLTGNWSIKAGVGDAPTNDVGMFESTVSSTISEGSTNITGTIANLGTTQITSVDINWQIDDGTVYTDNVSGLTLNSGETYNFTHPDQFNATAGNYTLKTWVSNMNGIGNDENVTNDSIVKNINVIAAVDAKLNLITSPLYSLPGDVKVSGRLSNVGGDNITSFDVTYNIDGGSESAVYSVTGVNIAPGESYNFTHDVAYNFDTEGNYTLNVNIANVNSDEDANIANNSLSKNITISTTQVQRRVVLEQFTTEQCPNCPPVLSIIEAYMDVNPYFILWHIIQDIILTVSLFRKIQLSLNFIMQEVQLMLRQECLIEIIMV